MSSPKPTKRCPPRDAFWLETESNAPGGRGGWYARAPRGHTIEDVLRPEYFGVIAQEQRGRLQEGDTIEIEPQDARWRLRLRVMHVAANAQLLVTREHGREEYPVKAPPGYSFVWQDNGEGGADGARWSVFKGEVRVARGIATEIDCLRVAEELRRDKTASAA